MIFPDNLAVTEGVNLRRPLKQNCEPFPVCLRPAASVQAADGLSQARRTFLILRTLKGRCRESSSREGPRTEKSSNTAARGKTTFVELTNGECGDKVFRSQSSLNNSVN